MKKRGYQAEVEVEEDESGARAVTAAAVAGGLRTSGQIAPPATANAPAATAPAISMLLYCVPRGENMGGGAWNARRPAARAPTVNGRGMLCGRSAVRTRTSGSDMFSVVKEFYNISFS